MVNKMAVAMLTPSPPPLEAWRSELETQRKAIYRDCPRDRVIDREHALVKVAGVMLEGTGAVIARRYVLRGLLNDGFSRADVARVLHATPEELDRATGELAIYAEGAKKLAELLERTLPTLKHDTGYVTSMARPEDRQGNLTAGSRGWRTPPDAFPQSRDYRPSR